VTAVNGYWRHVTGRNVGSFDSLSEILARETQYHLTSLPDLRKADTLLLLSDYAGAHRSASHEVYTFLLLDSQSLASWNQVRTKVREAAGLGAQRRMSYTTLRDGRRRNAVGGFLTAANRLRGVIASFVIAKDIESLFEKQGCPGELAVTVARWKPAVQERLQRILSFAGFLLAGLSGSGQNVWWYSDEDEVFPNEARMRDAVVLFANLASHFLGHGLGHLRIGTAVSDSGDLLLEDLLAIPDLVAGSLVDMVGCYRKLGITLSGKTAKAPPEVLIRKARDIVTWLSARSETQLKSISYLVTLSASGGLKWQRLVIHSIGAVDGRLERT
jgi:hypothetical protein